MSLVDLKRLTKRRLFWFLLLGYPITGICSKLVVTLFIPITSKYPLQYGLITFSISVIVIGCTILEIISRLLKHELQGEKLKIREREGISIEEHNV